MAIPNTCCCKGEEIGTLVGILEQEIANATRISQLFQTGGVAIPPFTNVEITPYICNQSRLSLLQSWLAQKQAIFNSLFLG